VSAKHAAQRSGAQDLDHGVLSSLIGFRLRKAQLAIYADFMRGAPVRRLTPGQLAILIFVDRNPDMTQQQLCDRMLVEKSTLVVRLHRLAERGLIKRVRSTADRRQNLLELTHKGAATLERMLAFVAEHERKVTARLSEKERKQLLQLLVKIG
jgi:DNA-binding MarR family transcriptional regulator